VSEPEKAPAEPAGYDESYFSSVYGTTGLKRFSQAWWSVRWYAQIARRCLQYAGGHRLLEIGCGLGFVLGRLEREFETWGVDLSPYAIRETARFAPASRTMVANIEDGLPPELEPGSFDLVMARYVFEHLHDPQAGMRRVASLLRPGGMLFYAVPHTGSIGARRKGEDWYASTRNDPTHCSLLSPAKWLEITAAAGLEIERESADGWWDVPYFAGIPGWLQLPVFIGPTAVAILSGRAVLPARWGENILVFARLPAGGGGGT